MKDDRLESAGGTSSGAMGGIAAQADRSGADIGSGTSLLALMSAQKFPLRIEIMK